MAEGLASVAHPAAIRLADRAATLRGLLLITQPPASPATPHGAPATFGRDVCRPPLTADMAFTGMPDPAGPRQRLADLPAGEPPQAYIRSLLPSRLLPPGSPFWPQLAVYIGQPIDTALTAAVVQEIVAALEHDGRYLADVYLPEQRVTDGILVVVVSPALLGQVIAKGQKFNDARDLACRVRLLAGEPVDLQVLADDLGQLNSSSSWRTTAMPEFQPGVVPGTTELVLNTTDQRPLRLFFGSDNTGTRSTGEGRYRVGVNVGNVFCLFNHQFDYTLTTASEYRRLSDHAFAYQMPLEGRQRLTARLEFTRTDVSLEHDTFRSRGDNQIASLEWTIPQLVVPKPLDWGSDMASEVSQGVEYKRIGSSLAFGQVPLSDVAPKVMQGYVAWRGAWQDALGPDQVYTRLTYSPGRFDHGNDDATFNAARPGAEANYWRLNVSVDKQIDLPG